MSGSIWGRHRGSTTPPKFAERNARRKIHDLVHSGTPLTEALSKLRHDHLFWQREVYEYCNSTPRTATKGLGKTRGKSWTPVWQTQWDKSSKGGKDRGRKGARPAPKGGKGKTPKGKGKGQWPDAWAFKDPKGKAFCRDYHLTGTCPGSCGRSHNCPVRQGGWVRNASPDKHTPDECPHATK